MTNIGALVVGKKGGSNWCEAAMKGLVCFSMKVATGQLNRFCGSSSGSLLRPMLSQQPLDRLTSLTTSTSATRDRITWSHTEILATDFHSIHSSLSLFLKRKEKKCVSRERQRDTSQRETDRQREEIETERGEGDRERRERQKEERGTEKERETDRQIEKGELAIQTQISQPQKDTKDLLVFDKNDSKNKCSRTECPW